MKERFTLYRRGGVFYSQDSATGKQESMRTKDPAEAHRLLNAKNEAVRQPAMNLQIAQIYLQHGNPEVASRTWRNVMERIIALKTGCTRQRWEYASADKAFNLIRDLKLVQTTAEHFLAVLNRGSVSTNVFLRRTHNFAMGMHWLPWPILPKKLWPPVKYREKRAITREEHQKIIDRERNPATRAFYQLLWHLGGSQSDIAALTAEDIDWKERTISYRRRKTGVPVIISFGEKTAAILKTLPTRGGLFPALARIHERHRAKLFLKRLATVGVSGVSLHSYRYAWAERAKELGYPERFAMQALGHSSKAVHRAYAKKAQIKLPPLEEFEHKVVRLDPARIALAGGSPEEAASNPNFSQEQAL